MLLRCLMVSLLSISSIAFSLEGLNDELVVVAEEEEAARDAEEKEDKRVTAAQASAEAKQDILIQNIRSPQASLQDVLAIVREMVREA